MKRLFWRLINSLKNIYNGKGIVYKDLSPALLDKNENKVYLEALKNAVENKNVKNIALTGIYGSGKSSILKTFQKENKEYNYLNISLASFQVSTKQENNENTLCSEDEKRIEKSILQQMFYHVKYKQIPNSRFSKISKHSKIGIFAKSIALLVWLCSFFTLFRFSFLDNLKAVIKPIIEKYGAIGFLPKPLISYLNPAALVIFTIGLLWVVSYLIYSYKKLNLIKLVFKNLELEVCKEENSSVLNTHLDEIIYLFETVKFDIVIIEDLDRFDHREIFTKLREMNFLINNSEQIKTFLKRVVFIYAIRDDVFKDEDRTKFFDFIVPVIPVVNSANSKELLKRELKKHKIIVGKDGDKKSISEQFISDISLYINDMRLLINIVNELAIYKVRLQTLEFLELNKLLAIIVFKNRYPNEFAQLQNDKGKIYNILNNKDSLVKELLESKRNELNKIEKRIKEIKDSKINSIEELRSIYIYELIKNLPQGTNSIILDGRNHYYFNQLIEDEPFEHLRKASNIVYVLNNRRDYAKVSFNMIETGVDSDLDYLRREDVLKSKNNNKLNELESKAEKIEETLGKVKRYTLYEIIDNFGELEIFNNSNELLRYLLSNSYIDEMYPSYISYFYEGSITRRDMEFVLSVKSKRHLGYDYKLCKIGAVLEGIWLGEFKQKEVLNYNLLDYLLTDCDRYRSELSGIFNQLKGRNDFIDNYIDVTKERESFFDNFCNHWSGFWEYLVADSSIGENRKDKYLHYIFHFANINDIQKMDSEGHLSSYVESKKDFLVLFDDSNYFNKVKEVIKELELEFHSLVYEDEEHELLDHIYDNEHYAINEHMIELMVNRFNDSDNFDAERLKSAHYTTVKQSGCEKLIQYINNNIDHYIEKVFLNIDTNTSDDEEVFIELLNNESISENNKRAIVKKVDVIIEDISRIESSNFWEHIFVNDKVRVSWKNIVSYHESVAGIDDILTYLNSNKEHDALYYPDIIGDETYFAKFCNLYRELWDYLINESSFDDELINRYLLNIVYFVDIEDIVKLNNENNFSTHMEQLSDFLSLFSDEKYLDKVKEVIEKFELDFAQLEYNGENDQLLNFIYENSYYAINEHMIELMLRHFTADDSFDLERLNSAHYTTIKQSGCDELIGYIENNVEDYITEVMLTVENNISEDEDLIIALINSEELSSETKQEIIENVEIKISNIKGIAEFGLWGLLFMNGKVLANWTNIVYYYGIVGQLEQVLIDFLNTIDNSKILSQQRIDSAADSSDEMIRRVSRAIFTSRFISDENYKYIIKSLCYIYDNQDFSTLSEYKIDIMLENNKLMVTTFNYDLLKEHFPGKHIRLLLSDKDKYIEDFEEFSHDADDIKDIICSDDFEDEKKYIVISKIDDSLIADDRSLLREIAAVIVSQDKQIRYSILSTIFRKIKSWDDFLNIKLLSSQILYLDEEQISELVSNIGGIYAILSKKYTTRPLLLDNEVNLKLLQKLERIGYISSYKSEKNGFRVYKKKG